MKDKRSSYKTPWESELKSSESLASLRILSWNNIKMEKLIELLNKYLFEKWEKIIIKSYDTYSNPSWTFRGEDITKTKWPDYFIRWFELITKQFWFIQRLVQNDKIAYDRYIKEFRMKDFRKFYYMSKADNVIANLAIQENPISFLISIFE